MVMDSTVVKGFLRVDLLEDIDFYIETAEEYFYDAVGQAPDPEKNRDVYAVCCLTQELYDHRTMISDDPAKDRNRHVVASILDHIRIDKYISDEGSDSDEG